MLTLLLAEPRVSCLEQTSKEAADAAARREVKVPSSDIANCDLTRAALSNTLVTSSRLLRRLRAQNSSRALALLIDRLVESESRKPEAPKASKVTPSRVPSIDDSHCVCCK